MLTRYLPARPGPLLALSALVFVHQFEIVGFSVLTPEIRDAFGVSDTTIGAVGSATGVAALLAAWPIGVLADRYSRRTGLRIAAVLFVVATLATSLAWVLPALVVARLAAGVAAMTDEVVQPGMLADLYEQDDQPRVFAVLRGASTTSGASALLLGAVAAAAGWRAAFLLTAVLGAVVLLAAWRVQDPAGTGTTPVLVDDLPVPVTGALARRRWLYGAAALWGACGIPFTQISVLFFEDVYATGPVGRGALVSAATVATLAGLVVGARLAERDALRSGTSGLVDAMTRSMVLMAASIAVLAVAPALWLSAAGLVGAAVAVGMLQVAFYPLVNRVSSPADRSRTLAKVIFTVGLGAIAAIPLFTVGDSAGYRTTTLALAVLAALMALACRQLRRDQAAAVPVDPAVRS